MRFNTLPLNFRKLTYFLTIRSSNMSTGVIGNPHSSTLDNPVVFSHNTLNMYVAGFAEVILRGPAGDVPVQPMGLVDRPLSAVIDAIITENANGWKGKHVYQNSIVVFGTGLTVTIIGKSIRQSS